MLINQDGKIMANSSQPIVAFETESEYENWAKDFTADELKRFVIVKKYMLTPGCYYEVEDTSQLYALPAYNKIAGVLYGVTSLDALYRYDPVAGDFISMN